MSRSGREYLFGGRTGPAGPPGSRQHHHHHRRGHSVTGVSAAPSRDADESLDLFSKNRRSVSVASSDESSDASSIKLGRLSLGSAKVAPRSGLDDLLSSTDGGKHDYDWLISCNDPTSMQLLTLRGLLYFHHRTEEVSLNQT
ncbi:hypothetical protein NL676_001247 [Syzygium grande]|nr:hypothetical protein NL676_001247 [Syzygium grande]